MTTDPPLPSRKLSHLAVYSFALGCCSFLSVGLLILISTGALTPFIGEHWLGWATICVGALPLIFGLSAIICGFGALVVILISRGRLTGMIFAILGILMAMGSSFLEISGVRLALMLRTSDTPPPRRTRGIVPSLYRQQQPKQRKEIIMAIVFEANYSKKLGLPGFSSHQYSVTVRSEVTDLKQVPAESNRYYRLLQDAVDKEIQHVGFLPKNGNGNGHDKPAPNGGDNGNGEWACSDKQKALILKIVDENKLDKQEIESLALERFGQGVKELNRLEASGLIEELLEKHGGTKENGRSQRRFPSRRYQGAK